MHSRDGSGHAGAIPPRPPVAIASARSSLQGPGAKARSIADVPARHPRVCGPARGSFIRGALSRPVPAGLDAHVTHEVHDQIVPVTFVTRSPMR